MGGTDVKIRTGKKKMAYKTFVYGSLLYSETYRTYSCKTPTILSWLYLHVQFICCFIYFTAIAFQHEGIPVKMVFLPIWLCLIQILGPLLCSSVIFVGQSGITHKYIGLPC